MRALTSVFQCVERFYPLFGSMYADVTYNYLPFVYIKNRKVSPELISNIGSVI